MIDRWDYIIKVNGYEVVGPMSIVEADPRYKSMTKYMKTLGDGPRPTDEFPWNDELVAHLLEMTEYVVEKRGVPRYENGFKHGVLATLALGILTATVFAALGL